MVSSARAKDVIKLKLTGSGKTESRLREAVRFIAGVLTEGLVDVKIDWVAVFRAKADGRLLGTRPLGDTWRAAKRALRPIERDLRAQTWADFRAKYALPDVDAERSGKNCRP